MKTVSSTQSIFERYIIKIFIQDKYTSTVETRALLQHQTYARNIVPTFVAIPLSSARVCRKKEKKEKKKSLKVVGYRLFSRLSVSTKRSRIALKCLN